MPTSESAEAFAKLVEARLRLNAVSVDLKNALESRGQSASANNRYRELQERWDEAFHAFEKATDQFSAVVRSIGAQGSSVVSENPPD